MVKFNNTNLSVGNTFELADRFGKLIQIYAGIVLRILVFKRSLFETRRECSCTVKYHKKIMSN